VSRKPILVHSNAPAPLSATGYGVQAGLFVPRFAKAGYDVAVSCMTSVSDHMGEWDGITCLPMGYTTYSSDILPAHARYFFGGDRGLILTLYDAWAIGPEAVVGLPTASWAPVHSQPMSAGDKRYFALSGAQPIAMSRYGEREMRAAGLNPIYVPHGVDTHKFRPLPPGERARLRKRLGIPEAAFLVASVGANKGSEPARKAWPEQLAAFADFHREHREAVLFIHSLAMTGWGVDMRPIIADLGIGDAVMFSPEYEQIAGLLPDEYVAAVQGCADVCLNPSYGEGFGLPILQAQSCGVPVIVADNSAQTELCHSGWAVDCQRYWYSGDQAWWHVPMIDGITEALEKAYAQAQLPGRAMEAARSAREFALGYDADRVMETYWLPALDMLEQFAGMTRVKPPQFVLETGEAGRPAGGYVPRGVPLPTIEAGGLRWLARGSHTDDWIAVSHEATLEPVLDGLLPEHGVFLDVGAHIGRWSLRLARKASRVIAVEPNPDTAAVLRYHLALNDIDNVELIEVAAWHAPAKLSLSDPNERLTGGSTRTVPRDGLSATPGEIEAMPLDAVLGDDGTLTRIDLVKLDVEGADLHALAGMAGLLARFRPVLFIEDHSIYGYYEQGELLGLLEVLGYDAEPFTARLPADRQAPYVIARPHGDRP
jgi:FkbM family methyltransferase